MLKGEMTRQDNFFVVGYTGTTHSERELQYDDSVKGQLIGYLAQAKWIPGIQGLVEDKIYCVYHGFEGGGEFFKITVGLPVHEPPELDIPIDILEIPAGEYLQFESELGSFPDIVNKTWKNVNELSAEQLGGQRKAEFDHECFSIDQFEHQQCKFILRLSIKPFEPVDE
ncbi:MAG: effector binding domain-containing protein [Bdellovibrionales bacterium]